MNKENGPNRRFVSAKIEGMKEVRKTVHKSHYGNAGPLDYNICVCVGTVKYEKKGYTNTKQRMEFVFEVLPSYVNRRHMGVIQGSWILSGPYHP